MSTPMTIECDFHIERRGRGAGKVIETGVDPGPAIEPGRVPRVARLMALALHFERLLREKAVSDYAELARLGHVTRARVTQIMNLLQLAPDLQETLLFLPRTERGRDTVILADLQPIASVLDWRKQRVLWQQLTKRGAYAS